MRLLYGLMMGFGVGMMTSTWEETIGGLLLVSGIIFYASAVKENK